MPDGTSGGTLGLHIAAETVWVARVAADGSLMDTDVDRVPLEAAGLSDEQALSELEETLESILVTSDPGRVGLLKAGASRTPPRPTVTLRRGWIEGGIMIACARRGKGLRLVTHASVKSQLGVAPTSGEFRDQMAERLQTSRPVQWANRAPAYAAALMALEEK